MRNAKASQPGSTPEPEQHAQQSPALRLVQSPTEEVACHEAGCENLATTENYCRAHYIKNWSAIQNKRKLIEQGGLRQFITDMVQRNPDRIIQAVRQDLANEDDFEHALTELGLHVEPIEEEELIDSVTPEVVPGKGDEPL